MSEPNKNKEHPDMTVAFTASDLFPLRYRPAVWLSFLVVTAAAFFLDRTAPAEPELLGGLRYLFFFLPLATPAAKGEDGYLRRVLVGCSMLLAAWVAAAFLAPVPKAGGFLPSLLVAGVLFAALGAWKSGTQSARVAALGAAFLTIPSVSAAEGQTWTGVALGIFAGVVSHLLAFSRDLDFLNRLHPWSFGFSEFRALFIGNRRNYWEDNYASGNWQYLKSDGEKPRHYAVAGIVHDRFPDGADMLDVGCGYGTLYPLVKPRISSYVGVDFAQAAIDECRVAFKEEARCRFEACAFEAFRTGQKFDVVVLNEILYYFPIEEVEGIFLQARGFLKDARSVLVISMDCNPKAMWTRHRLSRLAVPAQSQRVTNASSGSCWINTYQWRE